MATEKTRLLGKMVSRRAIARGLLATTSLAAFPLSAVAQPPGGRVFQRRRPLLSAPAAGGPLLNPPAIVPATSGGTNYALTMAQRNFSIGSDATSLYAYADPNNNTPNPNIVGPTITIPDNAKNGFAFSIDLANNLPLNTVTSAAAHAGHGQVQGAGETPHGFDVTNIHTHGLHVTPAQDNVYVVLCPTGATACSADSATASNNPQIIAATGAIQYAYNVGLSGPSKAPPHPAGTYWYHPHKHGSTAIQVVNGMSGALIVRGDLDEIPGIAGLTEQVMVIQQIEYTIPATASSPGVVDPNILYFGGAGSTNAQMTINGQVNPAVTMQLGEIQRWRIVNATYSAFISLQFGAAATGSGGTAPSLYAIATDGVPLTNVPDVIPVPYPLGPPPASPASTAEAILNEIAILAPGQRLDLLVQAPTTAGGGRTGDAFPLVASFFETANAPAQTIATVQFAGAKSTPDPMPESAAFGFGKLIRPQFDYSGIVPPPPVLGGRQSTWSINFNFNLGNGNAAVDVQRGVGTPVNEQFDPNNAQITLDLYDPAKKNTTYWRASASGALHAFHIHINSFLVAARSFSGGGSTQSFELLPAMIWRDTIRIDPDPNSGTAAGAPVHMVSQQYDYAGWYVMHCHVLDHEDFGMMVSVQIGS